MNQFDLVVLKILYRIVLGSRDPDAYEICQSLTSYITMLVSELSKLWDEYCDAFNECRTALIELNLVANNPATDTFLLSTAVFAANSADNRLIRTFDTYRTAFGKEVGL